MEAKEPRMDLFDYGAYFGSCVPVQARSCPLLKHAACACAAKQLGRAKGAKPILGANCTQPASSKLFDDRSVDWEWEGAYHYDRSIALLMEAIQQDQDNSSPNSPDDKGHAWETSRFAGSVHELGWQISPNHIRSARSRSDDTVAAVCYSKRKLDVTKGSSEMLDGNLVCLRISQCDWRCMVAPPEWYKITAGHCRRRYDAFGSVAGAAFQS